MVGTVIYMCALEFGESSDATYSIVISTDACRDVAKVGTVLNGGAVAISVDIGNDAADISNTYQAGGIDTVLDCKSGTVRLQIANHTACTLFTIDAAIGDVVIETRIIEPS